jgi:hypothetical protein
MDQSFIDALGADRIQDLTTARDLTRRFAEQDVLSLMESVNAIGSKIWKKPRFDADVCGDIWHDRPTGVGVRGAEEAWQGNQKGVVSPKRSQSSSQQEKETAYCPWRCLCLRYLALLWAITGERSRATPSLMEKHSSFAFEPSLP